MSNQSDKPKVVIIGMDDMGSTTVSRLEALGMTKDEVIVIDQSHRQGTSITDIDDRMCFDYNKPEPFVLKSYPIIEEMPFVPSVPLPKHSNGKYNKVNRNKNRAAKKARKRNRKN